MVLYDTRICDNKVKAEARIDIDDLVVFPAELISSLGLDQERWDMYPPSLLSSILMNLHICAGVPF
jgi:hypothetical protein